MEGLVAILYLGLATSAVAVTLTKADIAKPLRDWVSRKWGEGTMLSCPFCTSYWIALPLVIIYRPYVVKTMPPVDLLVSLAAIVGVAAIVSGITIQTIPNFKEKK